MLDLDSKSILSIAQRCGVSILKVGHHYVARCPFHLDDTPSLVFYLNSNSWTCFGKCPGKNGHRNGGGPIQFVQQYFDYDYRQAKEWIEQNFNYFETVVIQEKEPEPVRIVPHPWVIYWHSLLGEHRQYFHDRGFKDDFIDREMWGWSGKRYCLPVWEGEPNNSDILGVRQRKPDNQEKGFKYIGLKEMNPPSVWGRWYCRQQKTILAFAGEFDAALANQFNISSFSLVNGINSITSFPNNWPDLWFPDSKNLIACFDKKEEIQAAKTCQAWNKTKGSMKARVFSWPPYLPIKDFCELWELYKDETRNKFFELLKLQNFTYDV